MELTLSIIEKVMLDNPKYKNTGLLEQIKTSLVMIHPHAEDRSTIPFTISDIINTCSDDVQLDFHTPALLSSLFNMWQLLSKHDHGRLGYDHDKLHTGSISNIKESTVICKHIVIYDDSVVISENCELNITGDVYIFGSLILKNNSKIHINGSLTVANGISYISGIDISVAGDIKCVQIRNIPKTPDAIKQSFIAAENIRIINGRGISCTNTKFMVTGNILSDGYIGITKCDIIAANMRTNGRLCASDVKITIAEKIKAERILELTGSVTATHIISKYSMSVRASVTVSSSVISKKGNVILTNEHLDIGYIYAHSYIYIRNPSCVQSMMAGSSYFKDGYIDVSSIFAPYGYMNGFDNRKIFCGNITFISDNDTQLALKLENIISAEKKQQYFDKCIKKLKHNS